MTALWILLGVLAAIAISAVTGAFKLAAWADKQDADEAEHQRWLRDAELSRALKADAHQPVRNGYPAIQQKLAWQSFVEAHEWPADCPHCVWWVPAPSEAEDAIAVYRPCPRHDPALWPEQEKKAGQ